jgi:hypothetical protein
MKPILGLSHEALGAGAPSASDAMTSAPSEATPSWVWRNIG